MEEIWKDVVGYEGSYQVSNLGRVKSFVKEKSGKIKKQTVGSHGYYVVNLAKHGKCAVVCVHKMVADAFIGTYGAGLVVDHLDGNKLNNSISNLEIVKYRENTRRAIRMGLYPKKKSFIWWEKLSESQIEMIAECYDFSSLQKSRSRPFPGWWLAKAFGVDGHAIRSIIRASRNERSSAE